MPIGLVERLPLSVRIVPYIINGGGVLIQAGPAGDIQFPWDAELQEILFAGRPIDGSMSIDLLVGDTDDFPDGQTSMVGSGTYPSISSAQNARFSDFDDWDTTHFDAGTMVSLVVLDATNFDFMTVSVIVRQL